MDRDIPKSYKVQNGCHNCISGFLWYEHDGGTICYCTKLSPRPKPCNSVAMGESCFDKPLTEHESEDAYNKWMSWSDQHEVSKAGICDEYQEYRKKLK